VWWPTLRLPSLAVVHCLLAPGNQVTPTPSSRLQRRLLARLRIGGERFALTRLLSDRGRGAHRLMAGNPLPTCHRLEPRSTGPDLAARGSSVLGGLAGAGERRYAQHRITVLQWPGGMTRLGAADAAESKQARRLGGPDVGRRAVCVRCPYGRTVLMSWVRPAGRLRPAR